MIVHMAGKFYSTDSFQECLRIFMRGGVTDPEQESQWGDKERWELLTFFFKDTKQFKQKFGKKQAKYNQRH